PSGHVLAWRKHKHGCVVISGKDGSTAAALGGKEPPNAPAHHLDLQYCDSLVADVDGTIFALMHDRVLRWTYDGRPMETWPPSKGIFGEKHQKFRPLFRDKGDGERDTIKAEMEYPPDVDEVKDRPFEMDT